MYILNIALLIDYQQNNRTTGNKKASAPLPGLLKRLEKKTIWGGGVNLDKSIIDVRAGGKCSETHFDRHLSSVHRGMYLIHIVIFATQDALKRVNLVRKNYVSDGLLPFLPVWNESRCVSKIAILAARWNLAPAKTKTCLNPPNSRQEKTTKTCPASFSPCRPNSTTEGWGLT